jgi:hypothetical protein
MNAHPDLLGGKANFLKLLPVFASEWSILPRGHGIGENPDGD